MKVLITGAGGFLSRGLIIPFEEADHDLRLIDVVDFETSHEKMISDVSNQEDVAKAVDGVDAIVIAHMASRQAGAYDEVAMPFDVNIKGTALLFDAAVKAGIKKISLISSGAAVMRAAKENNGYFASDYPLGSTGMYGMTKVIQEIIAEQYQREHNLTVSSIRTAYIHDMETMTDKYGKKATEVNSQYADRRDIGEVTRRALLLDGPRYDVFYALSTAEAHEKFDVEYTHKTLDWKPKYDYADYPRANK